MLNRTDELAASTPEAHAESAARLRLRGLGYMASGRRLIDRIDLTLDRSGVTVLMGPNGAGKSLLLRLMHGLISPTDGDVEWNGEPMSAAIRARQAMVFQRPVLLRRSVAANIDFALKLRRNAGFAQRDDLLASVGLADKARQPARLLSGGEAQRLSLARALATEPETLFLDEPTASLDPASIQMIERTVLETAASGVKIVFVTHDIGQARRLADDVVFLHGGEVAEHKVASQFFASPTSPPARAYLKGQLVF